MSNNYNIQNPWILSQNQMVSTGQYFATMAGHSVLENGGNAIDAGIAAGLCLNTVHCDMNTFSGVAPIIMYLAKEKEVVSLAGIGTSPQNIDIEMFNGSKNNLIKEWPLQSVVPSAVDAWITALRDYGTMSFSEVVKPALRFALQGFPVHRFMKITISSFLENYKKWEVNRNIFLDNNTPPAVGKIIHLKGLAKTFLRLIEIEQLSSSMGREAALTSVRDFFYKDEIAKDLVEMNQLDGGVLSLEDFKSYKVKKEKVYKLDFNGVEIYTCGPWNQGPVLLEALNILKEFDLKSMGHNSARYVHYVASALDLAFADREGYYGDPDYVDVPLDDMLSSEYGRIRSKLINSEKVWGEMPSCGNFSNGSNWHPQAKDISHIKPGEDKWGKGVVENYFNGPADTSYVAVIDKNGNIFSATPSDGYCNAPIHPDWGIHISERGGQFHLDYKHPNYIEPGKRPRLTPCPALALKDGKPFLAFGTPGNDRQPQAMLQFLLNLMIFDMSPQEAVNKPRLATFNFPATTHPHTYIPGLLRVEKNMPTDTIKTCNDMGYLIQLWPKLHWAAGGVCSIYINPENGVLWGAADPRREGSVLGL